jgi:nitroimidazol reductase NimA-like FMN-containing flavoprotein (pyridoxamine 5'-phosphate oxidase superfamily)
MNDEQIEKIIRDNIDDYLHLSLATCANNRPWICELHFAYGDDFSLYFRSLPTRRHSLEIATNHHVAGNLVTTHEINQPVFSISFSGRATHIVDDKVQRQVASMLQTRHEIADDIYAESQQPNGHAFYKIDIEKWSIFGKFDGPDHPATKHSLSW